MMRSGCAATIDEQLSFEVTARCATRSPDAPGRRYSNAGFRALAADTGGSGRIRDVYMRTYRQRTLQE